MKFIKYKEKTPVNLSRVSVIMCGPLYIDFRKRTSGKVVVTWNFKDEDECKKVYDEILIQANVLEIII